MLIRCLACIIAIRASSCRRVMEKGGVVCEKNRKGRLVCAVFVVGMSVADCGGKCAKGAADHCEIGGTAR